MNNIKFPIAIFQPKNELKHISEVQSGIECNCICYHCRAPLIAVNKENNKQRPHFRHQPCFDCAANFETYIHWLAKEVICASETFSVPGITSKMVWEKSGPEFREEIEAVFHKLNIPEPFRKPYKYKFVLQESKIIKTELPETEYSFKSSLGEIRVDVKIEFKNQKLLIEPYYTNPINDFKLSKIKEIDESVVSINLAPFGPGKKYDFTLEEFNRYVLEETNLKSWIHIKKKKMDSLQEKLVQQFEKLLISKQSFFQEFSNKSSEIADAEKSLEPFQEKIRELEMELKDARQGIRAEYDKIANLSKERLALANKFLAEDNAKMGLDPWGVEYSENSNLFLDYWD